MTTERGILIGGMLIPGTDRVRRDPKAWWEIGEHGTRPRKGAIADTITLHWTAGNLLQGEAAARTCVARTKARKGKTGGPLEVGFHFLVAADGEVWQVADLAWATVHVGHRPTILRSIGIEHAYPGTMEQARKMGIEAKPVAGLARGQRIWCMEPPAALVNGSRYLVDVLCGIDHPGVRVPRRRGGTGKAGIAEHCDVPSSTKIDTAGVLIPPGL